MNQSTGGQDKRRRSLLLAGGGYRVAFQAGVLQVWLDEAGLAFDHFDGASGGNLNLAMLCQGMSGTEIAENWRRVSPVRGVGFNWRQWPKLIYAESLLTYDRFRRHTLPAWGLDWQRIRASQVEATFNVYNFSEHRLEPRAPSEMDEDMLIASITLPIWFPPVRTAEATYIDAVFLTDGNVDEAVRRGAEEIWIIWTISERAAWGQGFVADYFGIIETVANGNLLRDLARIERSNEALSRGEHSEFGRHIEVKLLRAEVPLHYIVVLGSDRVAEAVNQGVIAARRWCNEAGIPLRAPAEPPLDRTRFRFSEEMTGHIAFGEADPARGEALGRAAGVSLKLDLEIRIPRFASFMSDPEGRAELRGFVECEALGGRLPISSGVFQLLVHENEPSKRDFRYRFEFTQAGGRNLTGVGRKQVYGAAGSNLWADTTTLLLLVYEGHGLADPVGDDVPVFAAGIVRISFGALLRELTTFNVQGASLVGRAQLLGRFGQLFFGRLWDVYLRRFLSHSPF